MYIRNPDILDWFKQKAEKEFLNYSPSQKEKHRILTKLNEAVVEFNVLDAKRASWNREVDIWRTLSANQRR